MKYTDYNHAKNAAGVSMIEVELELHRRHEIALRRFLASFNPATHGISDADPLFDVLPDAWELKPDALREINRRLPGIVYEVPRFRDHLVDLSHVAFRTLDPVKAQRARTVIKAITVPVTENTKSPPITDHLMLIVQLVAEDFHLVEAVAKLNRYATTKDLIAALTGTFEDIPAKYITAIVGRKNRLREIIMRRVGEITGSNGRGEYDAYARRNPGYMPVLIAQAKQKAATGPAMF